jgi:hypothetical protein
MRKAQMADVLSRRLGIRVGRISSLTQCASEADLLPTASGVPYPELTPVEIARMLLIATCDEGLGCVPRTIEKYGGLLGPGSTFEQALGHALMRPESLAPSCSSLEVHTGDAPYAVFTVATADGTRTLVFGTMPAVESVERTVLISGAALFAIASELAGMSAVDVDKLLGADTQHRGA